MFLADVSNSNTCSTVYVLRKLFGKIPLGKIFGNLIFVHANLMVNLKY
jgi:hypothetical protein